MEQEILGKIRKLAQNNKQEQEDQSGISTELVIRERESEKERSSYKTDGK